MSDNEDLLGDDLGDQSLADYNLGNEEEEQLLADDYENAGTQNVPSSIGPAYREPIDDMVPQPPEYPVHEYNPPMVYQPVIDTECVVPNITVEIPNTSVRNHSTYAPYEPPVFDEHAVPPAIPAAPIESPQIVPSDVIAPVPNGGMNELCDLGRARFVSERPPGAQRLPQVRDIPDSLDKVVVPRGGRGRLSWRSAQFAHPYRRNNVPRGNFNQRSSFPPPHVRPTPPQIAPQIHPEIRPEITPEIRPEIRPDLPPELRPDVRMEPNIPQMGPEISPERPILPQEMPMYRPPMERPQFYPRFQFRPDDRPFGPRPNFDPRFFRPNYPRYPPMREIVPSHLPQVTIRQSLPGMPGPSLDKGKDMPREPEVRMLPVQLPPNLPPGGLAGKKVLINPHFKGTFQPPVEGLPAYIPTRIQKSPPINTAIENKFGPVKDIDDAAERFIAEQRNALARAAVRKQSRRSPQRYIENTTIEIENDLAHVPYRRSDDDDLLRRQEEFINANRAGLRRRMRSPSPARRSPSPRRLRPDDRHDEDSEYKRRLREQESLRERVLRAKEVRRRKNAVALHKQLQEKERELQEKEKEKTGMKPEVSDSADKPSSSEQDSRPDTTRSTPERPQPARDRSPVKETLVNSTVENLTPPHKLPLKQESPERALTPPLPDKRDDKRTESDDDLDLILGDIDGILSDDDDSGRFKDKQEPSKSKPQVDLRSKLPPKLSSSESKKTQRQKIVFNDREDKKKKEKSPPRRAVVTSSTKTEDTENVSDNKKTKTKSKLDNITFKSRQRITYEHKESEKESDDKKSFSNRRVILQRKTTPTIKDKSVFSRIEGKSDPSKPNPGIFSRAVRTAIGGENTRIVIKKDEPQVEFASESDDSEDNLSECFAAIVNNLPPGITDTRLKTLAGNDIQSLILDKEERSAKILFKSASAAESFKKKFNNKMVAASRLTVILR